MTETHWQLCIAFLAPLTPELYDEVGKWRSVSLRQSLNLYSELQQKQMESFFRPLQGVILVYSNTDILSDILLKHYLRFMRHSSSL